MNKHSFATVSTAVVSVVLSANAAFSATPKVGVTIALRNGYGPQQYVSNAHFKKRPVAEQMAKDGIDLCWYEGWKKENPLKSLKQFNAIWLITEHEDTCPYDPDATGRALKEYVEAGGGLFISHSAGRYPEAPVDAFWAKAFGHLGIELLHEEIADFSTRRYDDTVHKQALFHAATMADHPVVAGVAGLWLPMRGGFPSHCWSSPAAKYSDQWTTVLSTTSAGKSYKKNPLTNFVEWNDSNAGFYRNGAPIVAVRSMGKGRIVFEAVHKDSCGWMYNIDRWPNYVEKGELFGKRSDSLLLAENALNWVSRPSMKDPSFTAHYKPVEPVEPPYRRVDAGPTPDEKPAWQPLSAVSGNGGFVTGLSGLHSTHSDGESTVAEYAAQAKRLGLDFIVFTDDLAKLTPDGLLALRKECAEVSDDSFYACPGVEHIDMNGMRWIVCHDKIEYPKKDFLRDGRVYEVMKDGVVMQRNFYGHQNLYRGAILNTPQIDKKGIDPENFQDFNGIVPVAYDVDRPLWDNVRANKRFSANLHLVYPISFTRVKRAADMARAAKASVTCIGSLAGMRDVTGTKGAHAWIHAVKHDMFVRCGGDVSLDGVAVRRIPGTDIFQVSVKASSSAGLDEILIDDDGGERVVARFDAAGAKTFERSFAYPLGRQTHLVVTVRDRAGNSAHSVPYRLSYPHAGLHRCSDNANLLSYNPNVLFCVNWDDMTQPCWKYICRPPRHYQFSEAASWESYARNPTRQPGSRVNSSVNGIVLKGIEYPSEEKGVMPSAQIRFPLIAPNSVAILDQTLGTKIMTPTRGPDRATYGFGSIQVKVADGRYWIRRHRLYQFTDRIDSWWRAVWQRVIGAYRGGYTVCEGEIEFTEDVELDSSVRLCRVDTENPVGNIETYGKTGVLDIGGYYASIADPTAWYAWFPLAGTDPLTVREERSSGRIVSYLHVGEKRKYGKGEKIRYRFAMGSFIEPPREGLYLDWFAGMMDGTRFHHETLRGKETGVSGIVDITAEDHAAEIELGPTWFIQDYPVRVKGLLDNGSAYAVDDKGALYRPLGLSDGAAYVELPLEHRRRWKLMNLFVADDPDLRFTCIPPMPGLEKGRLQIFNPTKRDIISKVKNNMTGEIFKLEIPKCSMMER